MTDLNRAFPFRRALDVDPIIIPISAPGATLTVVPVDAATIRSKGVTAFKIHNPNPFWVWLRGWSGTQAPAPAVLEKGHYIPPGGVDLNSTQVPDWIAAVSDDEPGWAIRNADGSYRYAAARCRLVMIYGSGS